MTEVALWILGAGIISAGLFFYIKTIKRRARRFILRYEKIRRYFE